MYELQANEYVNAAELFNDLRYCVPVQGIIEGNNPGRVFLDDVDLPRTGFIWTMWGYYYLVGDTGNMKFAEELCDLLIRELIPASRQLGENSPILYPQPTEWEAGLPVILKGKVWQKIYRRVFSFQPSKFDALSWRDQIPEGYRFERIDENLLNNSSIRPMIVKEITTSWNSVEDYLAKEAPGVCLLYKDEIISLCTTVALGKGKAEISIITPEQYRNRGFATIAASAFIEQCLARNLQPNWECFWNHTISCMLAEKLGFEQQFDHPVYFWAEKA